MPFFQNLKMLSLIIHVVNCMEFTPVTSYLHFQYLQIPHFHSLLNSPLPFFLNSFFFFTLTVLYIWKNILFLIPDLLLFFEQIFKNGFFCGDFQQSV